MVAEETIPVRLRVDSVSKRFGTRAVIRNLSFALTAPGALGITGHNGAGKTTLLKLLAGLYYPDAGAVTFSIADSVAAASASSLPVKLVSPELALYDTLTAYENLAFFASVSGIDHGGSLLDSLLERVGLTGRGRDRIGTYSSGMKQRLKYAAALMTKPQVLLLDEPMANLDEVGKVMVADIMREYRRHHLLVVATNEAEDLKDVGQIIDLGS